MANETEKKIVKQIEYYFGDINLPRDKFLKEAIKKDDGWVSLDVLLTFKRLAELSKDKEVIANAIAQSELIEVHEDKSKLRRQPSKPLPDITDEEYNEKLLPRTAYAKGFPKDEKFDNLLEWLTTNYGPIDSLRMRFYKDKATDSVKFKGSCNIIFNTEEDCKKFLEAESVKYNEEELKRMTQKAFIEEKKAEFEARKNKKGKKGKQEEGAEDEQKPVVKTEPEEVKYPEKSILKIVSSTTSENLTWNEIKDKIKEITDMQVAHVFIGSGQTEGHLRFSKANEAEEFVKKIEDSKFKLGETEFTVSALTAEEEKEYYIKWRAEMAGKKKNNFQRKRKGKFSRDAPRGKK